MAQRKWACIEKGANAPTEVPLSSHRSHDNVAVWKTQVSIAHTVFGYAPELFDIVQHMILNIHLLFVFTHEQLRPIRDVPSEKGQI